MYYNTEFRGQIDLDFGGKSKKEKKEIKEAIIDHPSNWIVEDNAIHWNGEAESIGSLTFVANLKDILTDILLANRVTANGNIIWRGEDMGDSGQIIVVDNILKFKGGHV